MTVVFATASELMGHGSDLLERARVAADADPAKGPAYVETLLGILAGARAMQEDCMMMVALYGVKSNPPFNAVEFELELKRLVAKLRSSELEA